MKQTTKPIKVLWDNETMYFHLNDLWTYLPFKALKNVYPQLATYKAIKKRKWFNHYYATPEDLHTYLDEMKIPPYVSASALKDLKEKLMKLEQQLKKEETVCTSLA